jgi:hypothetical protein
VIPRWFRDHLQEKGKVVLLPRVFIETLGTTSTTCLADTPFRPQVVPRSRDHLAATATPLITGIKCYLRSRSATAPEAPGSHGSSAGVARFCGGSPSAGVSHHLCSGSGLPPHHTGSGREPRFPLGTGRPL